MKTVHAVNFPPLYVVLLALGIFLVAGCTSNSSEEKDAYFQELDDWWRGLVLACAEVGTTVEAQTVERPSRCKRYVDRLESFNPPTGVSSDHSLLRQSANHLVTLVGNVEWRRPAATNAMAREYRSIWRVLPENERYYPCSGYDDYWGGAQLLVDAPLVIYYFHSECDAEYESFLLLNSQLAAIRSKGQDE